MDEIVSMQNGIYPDDHIVKYAKIKYFDRAIFSPGTRGTSKINQLIKE